MSSDLVSLLAGGAISLAFSYIPYLQDWFNSLKPDFKRLVIGASLLVSTIAIFALNCYGWISLDGLTCDKAGVSVAVRTFILSLVVNQGAFLITPKFSWKNVAFLKKPPVILK